MEPGIDEGGERIHGPSGFRPGGLDLDLRPGSGGQHHQTHDRVAGNRRVTLGDVDLGVELPGQLDEACGSTRVQPALVDDGHHAAGFGAGRAGGRWNGLRRIHRRSRYLASADSSREATLMYLRPAAWAAATASARLSRLRTLASLMSMGRLTPAMTSILALSM